MFWFNYFLTVIIFSYCNGCLRSPAISAVPSLTTLPMIIECPANQCPAPSGDGVTVSPATIDDDCIYSLQISCTNLADILVIDGNSVTSPQTLICSNNQQYTFNNDPVTSVTCSCNANPCGDYFNTISVTLYVVIVGYQVDGNCIYSFIAYCDPGVRNLIINGNAATSPNTITCGVNGRYNYDNNGIPTDVFAISCNCPPNPCGGPPTGPDVIVSPQSEDDNCVFTFEVRCEMTLEINGMAAASDPTVLTCGANGQYNYDNNGVATDVTSVECTCSASPCFPPRTATEVTVIQNPVTADCIYTVDISCTATTDTLIIDGNGGIDSATLTCEPNGQYSYFNNEVTTEITCACGANPCVLNAGDKVTVSPVTVDGNCVFSLDVRCLDFYTRLQINGMAATDPNVLTCGANGLYTYDENGVATDVTSVECPCVPDVCNGPPAVGPFVTISAEMIDGNCISSYQVSCSSAERSLQINGMAPPNSPETVTCDGASRYVFQDSNGVNVNVNSIQCECNLPNQCAAPPTGPGVTVSAEMTDTNCVYTISVSCDTAERPTLRINGIPQASPQTLTCTAANGQYNFQGNDVVNVECLCAPNPCGDFVGPSISTTIAVADANCIYSLQIFCDVATQIMEINNNQATPPQTLTCGPTGQYNYEFNGVQFDVVYAQCYPGDCGANPCTVPNNGGVRISLTSVDTATCVFSVSVSCENPANTLEINFAPEPSPTTFSCSAATGGIYRYTDSGGTNMIVSAVQCN